MSEDIAPCIFKLLPWMGVYVQLHASAADCGVESQSSFSRRWEANDVSVQKIFYNLLNTTCAVLLPCTHQVPIRLCAQHYAVKGVQFCAIAVRVWSIKLFMATDIGRRWRECHHTSTVRWLCSWIGSCLCGRLAEGGSYPDIRDLQIRPLPLLPVRLCEKRGVPSASAYNYERLEGSDTNSD